MMCIPGLGENRNKPRELGSFFGYISMDCSSPSLPSESESGSRSASVAGSVSLMSESSSRSASPGVSGVRPHTAPVMEDRRQYMRRTANKGGASDSNQMASALFRPPTPEMEEVEEEPCVEERDGGTQLEATPFFTRDTGVTLIQGGTLVNAKDKFVIPGGIDTCTQLYRGIEGDKLE